MNEWRLTTKVIYYSNAIAERTRRGALTGKYLHDGGDYVFIEVADAAKYNGDGVFVLSPENPERFCGQLKKASKLAG